MSNNYISGHTKKEDYKNKTFFSNYITITTLFQYNLQNTYLSKMKQGQEPLQMQVFSFLTR